MDWKKVGENALAVGVLAVGGIIALANQSKIQDLGEKSLDAEVKKAERDHKKLEKQSEQIEREI